MLTLFDRRTAAFLAGVASSLVFVGASASAQGPITIRTAPPSYIHIERVPYGDINLATPAGERALHRRVSHAVERVCLYDKGVAYAFAQPDYQQCAWRAWNGARPQMMGAVYRARQFAYAGYRY